MKLILLSGGSGKRLWPLSNHLRSKQFLKVLEGADGKPESMVQRVWGQLERAGLAEHASIATGKDQVELIRSQLGPEVPVIVEPDRRDTFAAIALSASYLHTVEKTGLDETVIILPVDPFVEEPFFHRLKQLEPVLADSGAQLALMGVKPTHPAEKYGYIVPELPIQKETGCLETGNSEAGNMETSHMETSHSDTGYLKVSHFVEKPPVDIARELLQQQALWNCGVFAFRLGFLIQLLQDKGLPVQYEELVKQYRQLPKVSFDYEVVEKTRHIAAIMYDGFWKDLGTWNTLTEEIRSPVIGKGKISDDCVNTHVVNELHIPVAVLGLSDVVVSASPDGILVADKAASPRVKDLIHHVEQRPMYEECQWGSYRVLDFQTYPDGREVLTKRIVIAEGKNLSYHWHEKRSEVWTILSGEGEMVLEGRLTRVKAGEIYRIPAYAKHSIRAVSEMEIVEVQIGSELTDEDVKRVSLDWEEIIGSAIADEGGGYKEAL